MGNRAYIRQSGKHLGIYLHWNGGRDSVEAFLEYCKMKGYRSFEDSYGLARCAQVIGNFFGGSTSIGIEGFIPNSWADAADNGIYDVRGWDIVKRIPENISEQQNYDRKEMLIAIDEAQPTNEQLGKEFFDAETKSPENIAIGDEVYIMKFTGRYLISTVIGVGEDRYVNGANVKGIPYVNEYGEKPEENINNYLREKEYRVISK